MHRSTEKQDKLRFHKLKILASLLSQRQTASCNYGSLCPNHAKWVPSTSPACSIFCTQCWKQGWFCTSGWIFLLWWMSFCWPFVESSRHSLSFFSFPLMWLLTNCSCFWQPCTYFGVSQYICYWFSLKIYEHLFCSLSCFCIFFRRKKRRRRREILTSEAWSKLNSSEWLDWVIEVIWIESAGKIWWPGFLVCASLRDRG